ncbi:MAG: prolyl oligopeptidase family serine peptidase [Gemmatimonadales bacterium]|nr:prolyl oligopeptidase family serine peptidase [Gemmatimonadales bacterium]NIN13222.1 prolyl oligopeptidase family serine peptidase [Gemmatimonadales bacterium]NIN51239.1 prolyl oligopeptidase family serine peptidase [Gemmatimonadales bacterium]NIP08703.1 prolyl oligopeptidase family serine peptidase [Gemmatimonadales bacterium]NIR00956.1 prolyl oligopeptidase family serine peptidase [Gemmatimonadales bacterium]
MRHRPTSILVGPRPHVWAIIVLLSMVPAVHAQEAEPLTLDRLFTSFEFSGERFGPARWLDEGSYTTLERSEDVAGGRDIVKYDAQSARRELIVPASWLVPEGDERPLRIANYTWSTDRTTLLIFTNTRRVWRFNTRGDYWVLDLESRRLRQLGGDAPESSLMYAKFSPDGSRVAYVSENNLYVEDVESGEVVQLTDDGSRTILNGRFDWVYEEEFFLGSRFGADGFRWSPDGKRIAYWQLDASGVREFLLINNTDSLYSYTIPVQFPKAGTTNSAARVGVVPADGGETVWLQIDADPRNSYIARMGWSGGSDDVAIQHMNRLQNTNRVMLGDARTGAVRTVLIERDEAWLDPVDYADWLSGGSRFTWVSERDGWRRVYLVSRDGRQIESLTPPETDVVAVSLVDEEDGWLYYTGSPQNATQRYLFRVPLDGSLRAERLSPSGAPGWHSYQLSPGGERAIHTYSTFNTPPVISLVELPTHRVMRSLVENLELREKVTAVKQRPTEFFRVDIGDGVILDGWMMKPDDFDPAKKYPVLFFGYGHPWGQTVLDRWGGSQMLWHQYLTGLGYLVMSLDNRGTPAPRGREWRKVAYKKVDIISSQDQANGVRAVAQRFPFVDAERVGIWGWSGGGSLTLDCLFRYPDVYHTGMAVAALADHRYYDTIYQERYLGLPQDEEEAYEQNSPITFAHQLEGNLLLVHGTGDDNVHYQGIESLINALVRHNKHFTMMAYPNRSHGIFEGPGTTRHLFGLLTRYLQENLPAGGR